MPKLLNEKDIKKNKNYKYFNFTAKLISLTLHINFID